MDNNEKQNSQFSEEEIKKMREEVLRWIEKKEKVRGKGLSPRQNAPGSRTLVAEASPPVRGLPKRLKTEKKIKKSPKVIQPSLPKIFPKPAFKKVILMSLGIILIFFLVMTWGIYGFSRQNQLTILVSKIIPYPAMFINGQPVRYSSYVFNLKVLNFINSQQGENKVQREEIKKRVIHKFVREKIINQLAKTYGISITEKELEESLQTLIKEVGSRQNFEKILKELYNFKPRDFKKNILKPYLIQQKLLEVAATDSLMLSEIIKEKIDQAEVWVLVR